MDEKEILNYWDNLWKKDNYYAFWDIPIETDGENESFDYVVSIGLNEHFFKEDRVKVFSEMERVTKRGGYTIVIVPNKWGGNKIGADNKRKK
ncbi:MAG: methyltransferase domain-containing protein [Candidatus Pacearchaeota archaeon]|nr:methyltransferase domain-containing protein [Candidatus Pacearchaeota archaeon]